MSIERLINHHPKYLSNSNNKLNNFSNITNNSCSSSNITIINSINSNTNNSSLNSIGSQDTRLAQASLNSTSTTTSTAVSLHGIFSNEVNNHIKNEISLRFLNPDDINELKTLCSEWFPVDYPDSWYIDITSSKRFYSLAAIYEKRIIGMIVAEIRNKKSCDREDWYILSRKHPDNTQITYILSLGVFKEYRRLGVATLLFDTLYSYLKTETECKAIFLHVLCCNSNAIRFYEKNNFQRRSYLPNYYTIKGQLKDGYCYAKYMRDGEPPWTFSDYWKFIREHNPCQLTRRCVTILSNFFRNSASKLVYRSSNTKDFYRIS